MTNKELIEARVSKLKEEYQSDNDFILSGYPKEFDRLTKKEFSKVLDAIGPDYTDIDVAIKGRNYVVEITCVDNEIGFGWLTREEYVSRYGNERYEKEA